MLPQHSLCNTHKLNRADARSLFSALSGGGERRKMIQVECRYSWVDDLMIQNLQKLLRGCNHRVLLFFCELGMLSVQCIIQNGFLFGWCSRVKRWHFVVSSCLALTRGRRAVSRKVICSVCHFTSWGSGWDYSEMSLWDMTLSLSQASTSQLKTKASFTLPFPFISVDDKSTNVF